jgi:EmrB/QacA subfamily drug resistance transporter
VTEAPAGGLRMGTSIGRWVLAAAVLGSGVAFLDGTVVNVALPAIAKDLNADLADLQWVLTGYLLTLTALLVLGGSLGDLFGRRKMFLYGLVGFGAASLLCGVAPTTTTLIAARCLQGVAAALLMPGSLAIISASFHPDDRGMAIGAWSGLGGIATAIGPFLGGYLIDAVSWRLVFLINLPIIAATIVITLRHVPESMDMDAVRTVDIAGAATLGLGLGGVAYALIEGPAEHWSGLPIVLGIVGAALLAGFIVIERRSSHPMVPLGVFRSRQFSGANAVTLVVYAALSATTFLLVVHLQTDLGYNALEAGAALLPITILMLLFSARSGALAQRIGPRIPMTIGPVIVGAGMLLFAGVKPGVSYWTGVLPGVVVLSIGLVFTVAPLTATVLGALDDHHAGIASAINNAIARLGGLLAIALLPTLAGISAGGGLVDLESGFATAMYISAGLSAVGGVVAWLTIRRGLLVRTVVLGNAQEACGDPCLAETAGDARAA